MTYQETVAYIFEKLPMFQRIGAAAYKANLDNTLRLMDLTEHPENKFKSIHIAGTNGKGSTSAMISSILQETGMKVGLYTSPHLVDFRERIKINGKKIPKKQVTNFISKYREAIEAIQPSFFEISVALSFDWFAEQNLDIAVIETGMGGRLDSTNVITPLLSVITNIGYDHTAFLGNTKIEIAKEKAGIIKKNIPVVIGEWNAETNQVFKEIAKENNCKLLIADKHFFFYQNHAKHISLQGNVFKQGKLYLKNIECPLNGAYQQKNILTAIAAIHSLKKNDMSVSIKHIQNGLKNVIKNTNLRGRWEQISNSPKVICDVGHNIEGFEYTFRQLLEINYKKLHVVFGTNNDKNLDELCQILPKNANYYFCQANVPRALAYEILTNTAKQYHLKGSGFKNVVTAYKEALKNASNEDLVFVGGSTFVVGEVLALH